MPKKSEELRTKGQLSFCYEYDYDKEMPTMIQKLIDAMLNQRTVSIQLEGCQVIQAEVTAHAQIPQPEKRMVHEFEFVLPEITNA